MKALIGFKAFYFFGSVSVRFRCICEMAFIVARNYNVYFALPDVNKIVFGINR